MTHVMLIGNPNCGKTTLFNALTGDNQRVGNWPGVTVEKKSGVLKLKNHDIQLTDLPGVYSLATSMAGSSQDERIAALAVSQSDADVIINVIDACNLERHLYLTSQLLERGLPVIVALNMMDIAVQRGISIDVDALSKSLQCRVIAIQANQGIGLEVLKQALLVKHTNTIPLFLSLPSSVKSAINQIQQGLMAQGNSVNLAFYRANRLLEGDAFLASEQLALPEINDADILVADARYQAVHQLVIGAQTKRSDASEYFTAKLDRLVLHRFWALPIFISMMYLMFLFAINIGGAFQDFFDISSDATFVQGAAVLLHKIHSPDWLVALIANGIGKGINTTLTFIPVIAAMFFFLSLLEISGYMARAAFVVDKIMRLLGLPGKSFVPMIVGFGCNVPAIMAARTLDSERDRLLTILMSPFMSCSARLAIYSVFVAAFFPTGGQNIVFSLYIIGILMAVLTGLLLRKTLLSGQSAPLIIELPAYHKPALKRLLKETAERLKQFIWRAGKLIVPVCVILGGLNALTIHGGIISGAASSDSVLSWFGQCLTPLFSPMGIHQDNWPATVGLLTGMLAKEVVIGSLNTLYAQIGMVSYSVTTSFDWLGAMHTAIVSIPKNISLLGHALMNPLSASAPIGDLSKAVYGIMYERFDGKVGAYAYLLFVLLYIPCVSTMAAIRQEASRKLMWFSIVWSLIVAYAAAVLFYQLATVESHPLSSFFWSAAMAMLVISSIWAIKVQSHPNGGRHAITAS